MALDDVLFKKMNSTQWNNTVQAKANGAIYLDQLTRETGVEKFVVFSSVSGRYGVIGQSNYAWGNSVMEEVCKRRSEAGYHALAIQWGAIDNAGFVAMNAEKARMVTQHFGIIPLTDALNFLDDVLVQSFDDYSVMYNTYKLKQSKDQVVKLSSEEVIRQIEKVIKIDLIKGNQNDTLEVLGIDSLQTVEIQTLLIKLMQEVLPLKKISGMKIGELRQLIQDRFDQPAKNDSMKKEVSKENAEVSSSLIRCRNKTTTKNAVYLFLGYGVDEKKLKISSTEKFDVHIAAWEESPNIDLLSSKIFEHIEANGYQKVTFLTHSAGYQIANSVMQKIPGRISQLISISFVKEGVIENLASADADRVSLKVFEERYRDSAVFIEGHLPVEKLKRQLKLLSAAIATSPYLPPDLILQPRGDILCDPKKLGVEIAGTHHVESFDMNEIYSHI